MYLDVRSTEPSVRNIGQINTRFMWCGCCCLRDSFVLRTQPLRYDGRCCVAQNGQRVVFCHQRVSQREPEHSATPILLSASTVSKPVVVIDRCAKTTNYSVFCFTWCCYRSRQTATTLQWTPCRRRRRTCRRRWRGCGKCSRSRWRLPSMLRSRSSSAPDLAAARARICIRCLFTVWRHLLQSSVAVSQCSCSCFFFCSLYPRLGSGLLCSFARVS